MPKSKKSRKANTSKLGNLRSMAKSRKAKRQKVPRLKLEYLPNELVIGTFSYLNMKDLINCSQVSKRFRAIANDELGHRKEDLLKVIQNFQCFKCKKVPGPGDQSNRYLCKKSSHILCEKHKKSRKRIWHILKNKCPCGSRMNENPSQSIAKKLQNLPWMCQNYKWGCLEVKVDAKNLETHHGKCIFRRVFCPFEDYYDRKKVCFKDIFDHVNTAHKDDWYELNGDSNKWTESINIEGGLKDDDCWPPSKMTNTNGDVFGLVAKVERYSTLTY